MMIFFCQMVRYLRTCLAKSCGIKNAHVTTIDDWLEQAPYIASYSQSHIGESDGVNPLTIQHRQETVKRALLGYSQLLLQSIRVQTCK